MATTTTPNQPNARATDNETAAILHTVRTFLGCIRAYDRKLMHSLVLPHGRACLLRPDRAHEEAQPMMMTLEECINRVFALYPFDSEAEPDEQGFDEVVLLDQEASGQIACVWCPYRFLHRGNLHHTGSNIFSLVKIEGRWIISGIADVAKIV